MSYIGLEMIKLGIGSVLVAVAMSACSTAAERASFAILDEDSGTPSADDANDSGDPGADSSTIGTPESDAGDAGNPDDGSAGDDAGSLICDGLAPPSATSDDCLATQPCYDCGDNGFIYRCKNKNTDYVPPNAHCSKTSIGGEVCCRATCVRTSMDDTSCSSSFPMAWQCANKNADQSTFIPVYGCSRTTTNNPFVTMCCKPTVVPEWL